MMDDFGKVLAFYGFCLFAAGAFIGWLVFG
jgi:hypothetical protein